jgi:hypothetical protein
LGQVGAHAGFEKLHGTRVNGGLALCFLCGIQEFLIAPDARPGEKAFGRNGGGEAPLVSVRGDLAELILKVADSPEKFGVSPHESLIGERFRAFSVSPFDQSLHGPGIRSALPRFVDTEFRGFIFSPGLV